MLDGVKSFLAACHADSLGTVPGFKPVLADKVTFKQLFAKDLPNIQIVKNILANIGLVIAHVLNFGSGVVIHIAKAILPTRVTDFVGSLYNKIFPKPVVTDPTKS